MVHSTTASCCRFVFSRVALLPGKNVFDTTAVVSHVLLLVLRRCCRGRSYGDRGGTVHGAPPDQEERTTHGDRALIRRWMSGPWDTAEAITDQPGRRADVPPPAKRVPGSGTYPLYAFTFYCRRFRALGRRPRCWMPLPLGSRTGGRAPRGPGVRCRSRGDIFPRGEVLCYARFISSRIRPRGRKV